MEYNRNRELQFLLELHKALEKEGKVPKLNLSDLADREKFTHVMKALQEILKQLNISLSQSPQDIEKNKMIIGLAFQALFAAEKAGNKADYQLVVELVAQVKKLLIHLQTPEEKLKNDKTLQDDINTTYVNIYRLTKELQKTLDPTLQLELDKNLKELEKTLDRLNIPRPSIQPEFKQEQKVQPKPARTVTAIKIDTETGETQAADFGEMDASSSAEKTGGSIVLTILGLGKSENVETEEHKVAHGKEEEPEYKSPTPSWMKTRLDRNNQ